MRSARMPSPPRLPFSEKKQRMPLRARRRRMRALLALLSLILIAGSAWAIGYTSYLPRFSVNSLSVVGATSVPPRLVQAYAETLLADGTHPFLSHNNILLFNAGAIGREIVGYFPRIKSAQVSRTSMLATAATITVTERQLFALWCVPTQTGSAANDCYQMDSDGFIFARASAQGASSTPSTPSGYTFSGGVATTTDPIGRSFAPAHFPGILALMHLLAQDEFTPRSALVASDQDFSVTLQSGFYLKASFGEDPGTLVNNLQLILASDALQGKEDQLEYVDLRFGNRVYYKLKGGSETKAAR